jgi:serine/threonine-protein kinase
MLGRVIDNRYRIDRDLGSGGSGTVYGAFDAYRGAPVAIKILRPEAATDAERLLRFDREARVLANIRCEHVVTMYGTGKLEGGEPYLVMELLEGSDLGGMLEAERRIPYPRAVDYILQACTAVHAAHEQGIVHRDIKLSNLFCTHRPNRSAFVKVLDFGLAKEVDFAHPLTATMAVLGSPLYMSPEQMRASRDVDLRTDIWSLGVCLFELVTGRPPFDAPSIGMLFAQVLTEAPPLAHVVDPSLPEELSVVIAHCLEKKPEGRFKSAADLAFWLRALVAPAAP